MPRYKRARGGYRRNIQRRNRTNFTYGNVVDKVIRDVSVLKGLINTEFKTIDTVNTGTVSTTAGFVLLNGTAPGDDFDTRDGRQIRVKSVQVTITWIQHATAVVTFLRVIIFIDKQPNEVTPVVTQLLDTSSIVSFRNLDQRKRFIILKDKVLTMSDVGTKQGIMKWYKQLDAKTMYDAGTAGTIADITTNALFLMLVSSEASNQPTVTRVTRVRFIDN